MNRGRRLDASVPRAAKTPKCRSSDVLQEGALNPFRHPPTGVQGFIQLSIQPHDIPLWVFFHLIDLVLGNSRASIVS
jgi:hypothetical protein